jgi:DNA processing protein
VVVTLNDRAFYVGFNHVKGVGAVRLKALIEFFGDLTMAWNAPADALRAAGLPQKVVEQALKTRQELDPEKLLEKIEKKGIQVLTWEDAIYPRRLKEIDQPPPVLYVRGEIKLEDEWSTAVVGTRRVTVYGRQVTEELASYLAHNGVTVVSGLARGVDGLAHDAAIKAGGRTLAVLGCGVDIIYPPEHRKLAEQVMANGALLSDYAPGTPPDGVNFPPRNRIISGLSAATVVVEAGETSGALITAKFAVDQGRDVFAIPGGIHAPQSIGANKLISDGARPLLRWADLLETLQMEQVREHIAARRTLPMDEMETALSKVISSEPIHIDNICNQTGMAIEKVSATLVLMELKGMVRQVGGMNYVTIKENRPEYKT